MQEVKVFCSSHPSLSFSRTSLADRVKRRLTRALLLTTVLGATACTEPFSPQDGPIGPQAGITAWSCYDDSDPHCSNTPPAGDPSPSAEDLLFTRKLVEAGKVLGVDVLDHLILGSNRYVSLQQRGML